MSSRSLRYGVVLAAFALFPACKTTDPGARAAMNSWGIVLVALAPVVEQSSPTQYGLSGRVSIPVAPIPNGAVLAVAHAERQWWDGGHDNVFGVGMQGRRVLNPDEPAPTWVGAEATYNRWIAAEDVGNGPDPSSDVFGVSALAGKQLSAGTFGIWGSAGLLFFSDFERDGNVWLEGGTGWEVRAGVEVPLGGR